MTDEPDRQELEDRIDELEQTIGKMLPSRRDALKFGGAALLGGAAMSGTASAGTSSTGTIGTSGAPVDVVLEDATGVDTISGTSIDITDLNSLSGSGVSVSGLTSLSGTSISVSDLASLSGSNISISGLDSINGDDLVTSAENQDYEIQKNGSDASGVINFKT